MMANDKLTRRREKGINMANDVNPPLGLSGLLCRCRELRRLSESREHKGPGHGGCFAANDQPGCPCCDADAELNGMVFELIERLEMLEFLLGNFQMHSPKMNSEHSWRFRGGWPMTHAIGPDPETAIRRAMAEVEREKSEA